MRLLSYWIQTILIIFPFTAAYANSEALGFAAAASNEQYRRVKALGPYPSRVQIQAINDQINREVQAKLREEQRSTWQRWKQTVKNAFSIPKEKIASVWQLEKHKVPLDKRAPSSTTATTSSHASAPPQETPQSARSTRAAPLRVGSATGGDAGINGDEAGATTVNFSSPREEPRQSQQEEP